MWKGNYILFEDTFYSDKESVKIDSFIQEEKISASGFVDVFPLYSVMKDGKTFFVIE